ncbi:MAG: hypothetical protein ACHQET_11290 [Chitinophagales bacterium]
MKNLIGLSSFLLLAMSSAAQHYYKDILLNRETTERWKIFRQNKVKAVILTSYEDNGQPTDGFECKQTVARDFSEIDTYTLANSSVPSHLFAFYDQHGFLVKTIDTSDTYQSTTDYEYQADGRILSITNISLQTDNQVRNTEQHIWSYNPNGKPISMLKISNRSDSTWVKFVADEQGNIIEEHPERNGKALPVIYYYYDNKGVLTDIVRYNAKAQKLLPDYIFETDGHGQLSSMLFVPEGSTNYQKWLYQYKENGLKIQDTCYNKRNELMGKIQYEYEYYK